MSSRVAIGAMALEGKLGRRPRRFDVHSMNCDDIGPFKTPQPAPLAKLPEAKHPGLSEKEKPFHHRRVDQRPHLKLIHNNNFGSGDR